MNMIIPTIFMAVFAAVLLYIAWRRGQGEHIAGLQEAGKMMVQTLPLLVLAFIVANLVQVLIPREILNHWIGTESGIRGILLGALAGGMTPGGPYVNLPVAAALFKGGASVGTMVAFLTGWSLWAFNRLPMEVGILGWKLTLIRFASVLILPPIAGFIAQLAFGNVRNVQ